MRAIELEAFVKNHRLELVSDKLPERAEQARVIVLFETTEEKKLEKKKEGMLARWRQQPIAVADARPLTRDEIHERKNLR